MSIRNLNRFVNAVENRVIDAMFDDEVRYVILIAAGVGAVLILIGAFR